MIHSYPRDARGRLLNWQQYVPQFTVVYTDDEGNERVLYAPNSEAQVEYHLDQHTNTLMHGNRGGGKSWCGRWDCHIKAMHNPGYVYCILRRTYPELQRTHLIHINQEMKMLGGYFNKSEKIAYYPNGSKGFFAHCEGDEDVLKLLSAEFYLMFFDELSTFEWDMFIKLSTSCRVPSNSGLIAQVRGGTNPLGVSAEEINHYFVEKDVDPEEDPDYDPADWHGILTMAEDNVNLDVAQYQKRFAGMPAHVRKAWLEGEFALENAMFDYRATLRVARGDGHEVTIPYHTIYELPMEKILKHGQIYRAYDHGYWPDPAYCVWIAHVGNRYIVIHEKLWWKTVVADIAKEMKEITKELSPDPDNPIRVVTTYADPTIDIQTGADVRTIKDIFEENGVPIELSVNSRELYASALHSALGTEAEPGVPKIQIYQPGCPYLVKTLPKQRFDPKKPLRMADSKTDHAAIAVAYFLISTSAMDRASIGGTDGRTRRWMRPKTSSSDRWILGNENVRW